MTERVEQVCGNQYRNRSEPRSKYLNIGSNKLHSFFYLFAFILYKLENLFGHFACVFVVRCAFPMQWPKIKRWANFDQHKNVVCLRCLTELECGCMGCHRFVSQKKKKITRILYFYAQTIGVSFLFTVLIISNTPILF